MRSVRAGFFVGLVTLTAPLAHAAQETNVYTATRGPSCDDRSRSSFSQWRCPGPAGYVAEYADEGNIAGISIWRPIGQQRSPLSVSWRGAGRVFGEKLEWHMAAGTPYAAILRIWRVASASDGRERDVEELVILKVSPSGACRVASVNARQARSNDIARSVLDGASELPCLAEL